MATVENHYDLGQVEGAVVLDPKKAGELGTGTATGKFKRYNPRGCQNLAKPEEAELGLGRGLGINTSA